MPTKLGSKAVERFEDEYGDERDVYEVADNMVEQYLESGNFERVA
jgi:hypothetical protein